MKGSLIRPQGIAMILALLMAGCSSNQAAQDAHRLPDNAKNSAPDGRTHRTVVLFRVAVEMDDKPYDSPFGMHFDGPMFHVNLGDLAKQTIEPGHSPSSGAGFRPGFPSTEDRKAGWAFLVLKPGNYGMALGWLSHSEKSDVPIGIKGMSEYLSETIQVSVPADATLIYIGTLSLSCQNKSTALKPTATCLGPKVLDEEAAAQQVVQKSLSKYAPMTKALASGCLQEFEGGGLVRRC